MAEHKRYRLAIAGTVQGVGFRPFTYRLAGELGLTGFTLNSPAGLTVEIEGPDTACDDFVSRLRTSHPRNAEVRRIDISPLPVEAAKDFQIRHSETVSNNGPTEILPDLATCADCVQEIFDPANRRFQYPFTNCISCGPRFSIIESIPWDRERTSMSRFEMCPACREEFESPEDRRFHAQPNACSECGPQLAFTDKSGSVVSQREEALEQAAHHIESGQIVALKGIGGFQLLADARSSAAIAKLRQRKHRPSKPFALMLQDVETVRAHCELSELENSLLTSPGAPIVILRRLSGNRLPAELAPRNHHLGVMLPHSPLHHLLSRRLGFPVIVTSGNVSGEPLCMENEEAFRRLNHIADGFLIHDRPIIRPLDDSVVRVAAGRELILRSARGYAPLSIGFPRTSVLAIGGDQKAAIALSGPFGIRCAQHIGDLESEAAQQSLLKQISDFQKLCGTKADAVACDLHPDYHGTRIAGELGIPLYQVQHHHAHIAACLAEHNLDEEVLGVAWDGTGYGPDKAIWGGEFLLADQTTYRRVTSFRTFPLPGGELAVRQPRYAALGLLHEAGIPANDTVLDSAFTDEEMAVAKTQIEKNLNTPLTSSAGRLFEAVAALLGICQRNGFEAQGAIQLESAAESIPRSKPIDPLPVPTIQDGVLDWEPMLRALLIEKEKGSSVNLLAARFLETMSCCILEVSRTQNNPVVVLSGGCFQNVYLLETTVAKLRCDGFTPVWPRRVPPNDGGLAPGQAVVASQPLDDSML